MLWIEWDAEMRGYEQGISLNVNNFNKDDYIKGAMAYIISIKWSWDYKSDWEKGVPRKKIKKSKIYTANELFAPLTKTEKDLIKYIKH